MNEDTDNANIHCATRMEAMRLLRHNYVRTLMLYILNENELVEENRTMYEPHNNIDDVLYVARMFTTFIFGLNCCAMARRSPGDRRKYRRKAQSYWQFFQPIIKANCPMTIHIDLLLNAELSALQKKPKELVVDLYENSIREADKGLYFCSKAMACECAAEYMAGQGDDDGARSYLKRCYQAYLDYGAEAKLIQLRKKFYGLADFSDITECSASVLERAYAPHIQLT